jgi:hypothetical protein
MIPIPNFLFSSFYLDCRAIQVVVCAVKSVRENDIQEEGWGKVRQTTKRLDRVKRA